MTTVVTFDFAEKKTETIEPAAAAAAIVDGKYCWLDIDDKTEAEPLLTALGVHKNTLEWIKEDQFQGQVHLGPAALHCTLVETAFDGEDLDQNAVHLLLGKGFLATVHDGQSNLVQRVHETYEHDFYNAAQTGGFLLFEFVDHLIAGYREALVLLSTEVDGIQSRLLGDVGDEILIDVSDLTRSLLDYRNAVVAARETVDELATRRSAFVEESTQPFLDRLTTPLDRLASDASTERMVLSESLNLYMGIVSHRTNKVVNRLTVVSMIFLPLNFLAAVYGMNFRSMPELAWKYSYPTFWLFSLCVTVGLLVLLRRKKWL